jgi:IS5 family transposase
MRYKKGSEQGGLFDYQERKSALAKKERGLDRLNAFVNWESFRPVLASRIKFTEKPKGGPRPWDLVLMLKILVLQKFHGLSDDETEFQILDRFSFQRFVGLDVSDDVPDAKTIWLFKERLGAEGVKALFDHLDGILRARGVIGRAGNIVDASFFEAPKQRNKREDNDLIKDGKRPESFDENPNRGEQKDTDARWTKKNDETHFGYKNHTKVDASSKLIVGWCVTPANVHDSQVLESLVSEGDGTLYADSAYKSDGIDKMLEAKGIENRIHERGYRDHPLSEAQKVFNKLKSRIRARVEHVYGRLAQFGADRFRRVGLARAIFEAGLGNLVYNLDRSVRLGCRA